MSLLYTDGFDLQDYSMRYAWINGGNVVASTTTASTRSSTGLALTVATATTSSGGGRYSYISRAITPSATTYLGLACNIATNATNACYMIVGLAADSGVTSHVYVAIQMATGTIFVYRGDARSTVFLNGTQLAASASNAVRMSTWFYLEVSATISDTVGAVTVRADGTTLVNISNVDTKNGGTSSNIDTFYIGGLSSNTQASVAIDDFYVLNNLGSTNNTFLGDSRVQTLLPTGAGSSTQLTPTGSASNYANVNDVPDSTTTYNGSATTGQRDTYAMGDLTGTTATVHGVQQVTHAFNSDAGVGQLKAAQKSGATVSYGATNSLGTSNAPYFDIFETNPATAGAYSVADVNALEGGAEVV